MDFECYEGGGGMTQMKPGRKSLCSGKHRGLKCRKIIGKARLAKI
jgi:hypothetical protein